MACGRASARATRPPVGTYKPRSPASSPNVAATRDPGASARAATPGTPSAGPSKLAGRTNTPPPSPRAGMAGRQGPAGRAVQLYRGAAGGELGQGRARGRRPPRARRADAGRHRRGDGVLILGPQKSPGRSRGSLRGAD